MMLEHLKQEWQQYRRALRHQDQPHFDQLFEYADKHADAAGYLNANNPFDPVVVSMLLEQEKRIHELEQQIATAREETDGLQD